MEIKKTEKQVKEIDVVIDSYTECDKCGTRITIKQFNAFNFEFTYRTGESYPDNGSGEENTMDLCPDCADELIELLKSHGYRVNNKEWGW